MQAIKLKEEHAQRERTADDSRRAAEDARNVYRKCLSEMCQEAVRGRPATGIPYRMIEIDGIRYLLKLDPNASYCEVGEVEVET